MAEPDDAGGITPRKKRGIGSYIIPAAIAILVIAGIVMFTSGRGGNPDTNAGPTPTTIPTIPQLQSSIATLTTSLDGVSGRLANLESTVSGLSTPDVTKADLNSLQANISSLSAEVANWTDFNIASSLDYWLTKDKDDDDIQLHILSAKDMRFVAEVTVFYDDPIQLDDFSNTTYEQALSAFYDEDNIGTGRDYTPNLIPYHSIPYTTTTWANYTVNVTDATWVVDNETYKGSLTFETPICYNTTVTLSDWECSSITFHTDSFLVTANEEKSGWIDGLSNLGDYDTISVKLLPSQKVSETGGDEEWI
ncbi:MAG TPA: hypothetical protein VMW50_14875 [Dehalococcoidia bacterium]|nr:hypothetical protein [Dehalococcoidia bacterium]